MPEPEIYNLSTLCRCCHADGSFKSLNSSYRIRNTVEIYENILRDTLGITIYIPPLEASYTICDKCITKLRAASNFKKQVTLCEEKFMVYCKNEQFGMVQVKTEDANQEAIDNDNKIEKEDDDPDYKQELHEDEDDYFEVDVEGTDDKSCADDNIPMDFKEEELTINIEVQENTTKEIKTNNKGKRKKNAEHGLQENESQKKVDTSCIIENTTKSATTYSCKKCGGGEYSKKQIYKHLYNNHDTFECKICKKTLKNSFSYKNHIKTHTEKIFECHICDKKYSIKSALKHHLNNHTKEKVFTCDYCKKSFLSKSVLRKHVFLHLGLSKNKLCELCGKSFNDISNLRSHVRTVHEKLRPFVCDILSCGQTFTAKKHLKEHQLKHGFESSLFCCDICARKYSNISSLRLHRLKHDNIFKCRQCPESFRGRATLKEHKKTIHNTNFPCGRCEQVLSSKNSLRRHLKQHTGQKYPCDLCSQVFTQKAKIIIHKKRKHCMDKIDNVEKTKCTLCGKSFKNIDLHMKSHKNRQYSCDLCPKAYPENNTLTRHKLQAHFGRSFDCEICGKKYLQKSKLKTHQVKIHRLKIETSLDSRETSG
ncbi:unnamed protein product [Chrysodeixis includens]|uniref:Zinc finger protein n=1 Tax=Chrysodeixis includens TaxID=689277 RepID=A0A9P0BXH0_CHRIL|nr:unnamed protein product [Chrysodeixis includens]